MKNKELKEIIKQFYDILDDLLEDCHNDLYEYRNEHTTEEQAKLIYDNVKLFTLKIKDRIEEDF